MFNALVLHEEDGRTVPQIESLDEHRLPTGDVLIDIEYSSLNYKDALAITGKCRIIREFPFVPGIDLAGIVAESSNPDHPVGSRVVLTGWGVGERHWGGMAQRARVKSEWLTPLPAGLDTRKAMIVGTAGLTAMLCVMTLQETGIQPDSGRVLVTGATGGVGSLAIALLHQLGYEITAVTGKTTAREYLRQLGASEIVSREEMATTARPLESQRWAGVVDTAGGAILARALAETQYGGCISACGLAADYRLETTVMPFILRNVSLRGVDSVYCPAPRRADAWSRLATLLPASLYDELATEIPLARVGDAAGSMMAGQIQGRILVNLRT